MGKFFLCTELDCNRKYITKNKLIKHLLDTHEIIKTDNDIGDAVEVTNENKKQVEAKKNKVKRDEIQEEKIKEINKKKQLELEAKLEAEKEFKQNNIDKFKELEKNKLLLQQKQIELDKKWTSIVSLVHERIAKNSTDCSICVEEMADTACVPCGHKNFCRSCIDNYLKSYNKNGCPVCRQEVKSLVKIYS